MGRANTEADTSHHPHGATPAATTATYAAGSNWLARRPGFSPECVDLVRCSGDFTEALLYVPAAPVPQPGRLG